MKEGLPNHHFIKKFLRHLALVKRLLGATFDSSYSVLCTNNVLPSVSHQEDLQRILFKDDYAVTTDACSTHKVVKIGPSIEARVHVTSGK